MNHDFSRKRTTSFSGILSPPSLGAFLLHAVSAATASAVIPGPPQANQSGKPTCSTFSILEYCAFYRWQRAALRRLSLLPLHMPPQHAEQPPTLPANFAWTEQRQQRLPPRIHPSHLHLPASDFVAFSELLQRPKLQAWPRLGTDMHWPVDLLGACLMAVTRYKPKDIYA